MEKPRFDINEVFNSMVVQLMPNVVKDRQLVELCRPVFFTGMLSMLKFVTMELPKLPPEEAMAEIESVAMQLDKYAKKENERYGEEA